METQWTAGENQNQVRETEVIYSSTIGGDMHFYVGVRAT